MAAISSITLADGQTTPASHVFKPVYPQKGQDPARWVNAEGTTMIGNRVITTRVRELSSKFEVEIRVTDPVLSAIPTTCCDPQNVPVIAYTDIGTVTFAIAKASTVQDRKNILAYVKNMLATPVVTAAVVDLESAW